MDKVQTAPRVYTYKVNNLKSESTNLFEIGWNDYLLGSLLSADVFYAETKDEIATIFQNSNFTLVPTRKISSQFYETTKGRLTQEETRQKAYLLFEQFKLKNPERIFHSYPFELSIGMAQRVAVSLALMNGPSLLLCDEPTSALDVKSAYEMVRLLKQLKEEKGMTMLVITHNIALAAQLCDRIAVMHQGCIVEVQDTKTLIESPMHAYTKQLLAALPKTEDLWNG